MQLKTPQLLAGTVLSLVLCGVSAYPAMARPLRGDRVPSPTTSEANPVEPQRGEVIRIVSNFVTVEMDNGETRTIPVARWKLGELEPGKQVWIAYNRIVEVEPAEE